MVDVIERGEPALALAHWTGIYWNGQELGFKVWQEVVRRLHARFDNLVWMKLSEVARYWAARELTRIERAGRRVNFRAPYACPAFTVQCAAPPNAIPKVIGPDGAPTLVKPVTRLLDLKSGGWFRDGQTVTVCFDLAKGTSALELSGA